MSARLMMVVLMAMICFTCVAWGASPREILFDDDVLTAAYKDIENMRYDELRSFGHFLSECTDALTDNSYITHLCDAALANYRLEFGGHQRPLDQMLSALDITRAALKSGEKVGRSDHSLFARYMTVRERIETVVTLRFTELRETPPSARP
jgi:hypothetical protein